MTQATSTEAGVTVENFEGKIETAYGNPLATPLAYSGQYEKVTEYDAIPAKEMPDKEDVLALVNNARKANARQKAMQAALDAAGIKKPTLEDPEVQLKSMVKILVAAGKDEATATQIAKATLGL